MHTIPYTYLVKFIPENKFYYGVRYAKGCHPDDFFIKYFTSSKTVRALIKKHGISSFVYEIRKTFDTADQAIKWESKVLYKLNVSVRDDFFNLHNNASWDRKTGWHHSEETKKKISNSNKGRVMSEKNKMSLSASAKSRFVEKENHPMYGKTHSLMTRQKISEGNRGKTISEDQKKKSSNIAKAQNLVKNLDLWKNRITWLITFPNGETEVTNNLTKFCKEHSLTGPLMLAVSKGVQTHHKGYKCQRIHEATSFSSYNEGS